MKEFIKMEEVSSYYSPITEAWTKNNKNKRVSLYHYTSTDVLDKILVNAAFWASNIFFLNDSSEFRAGLDEIRRQFSIKKDKKIRELIENYINQIEKYDSKNWAGIYTISFSTSSDDLNQWIVYAKESGICIELESDIIENHDVDKPKLLLRQKSADGEYLEAAENYNGFGNMEYGENKKAELATEIYESFVQYWNACAKKNGNSTAEEKNQIWEQKSHEAKQYLALRASYLKVKGFSNEQEVRISFFPISQINPVTSEKKFAQINYKRLQNGILRPYLEIYFFQGMDEEPKCPIKSIKIGPSGRQQNVYDSVVHRLKYGNVNVWNYPLNERFLRLKQYIKRCIDRFELVPQKHYAQINRIYFLLAKEWCEMCEEVEFAVKKAGPNSRMHLALYDKIVRFYLYDCPEEKKEEVYRAAEECVEKYKRDAFLSAHGILVDKSVIPYIY